MVHPPQPHHNPLVFASRSSRFDGLHCRELDTSTPASAKARSAKVRVAPRAFAFAPWPREAHRSAIPRPGRGPPGTWARVREGHVSSNQQQARIAGPCPRHPAMHRHKMGPLSERPRPPAPAALRGSSQRVRPKRQSVAQTGPFIAASSLRSNAQPQGATPLRLISNIDSQTGSLGHESLLQLRHVS